ncbi:MAG: hypothetical protein IKZ22_06130, partial [Kiritimatiellae bacterium]|nr:hypothetical protein [Kiritimatiellia bacterium]
MKNKLATILGLASCVAMAGVDIAPIDTSADRNPSPLKVDMERIGSLRPRSANEIKGSSWTLGCECLDRDFTD